jgi:hypothetical protein
VLQKGGVNVGKIAWGNDVGIPLGVGVANVLLGVWDEKRVAQNPTAFQFEPIFGPIATIAGIGMMAGNFWPAQGQVIAHAAMPLLVRAAYTWAKQQQWFGGVSRNTRRLATPAPATPVGGVRYGYPAPPQKPEFANAPAY